MGESSPEVTATMPPCLHQRDALVHRAEPHHRAGTTLLGQVEEVPVAETLADDDSLREDVASLVESVSMTALIADGTSR